MKKKIVLGLFTLVLVLISTFYGGYRLGLIADTRFTMEYMMNIKTFELADRAGSTITDFKEMKSHAKNDKALICKMRASIMSQTVPDWDTCKSTKECSKNISEGFYSEVDGIILEFKAINCDKATKYSLSDGAFVCLAKAKEKLGADAKLLTMFSSFGTPADFDENNKYLATKALGYLSNCHVDYQNPDNPNKVLRMNMDVQTGRFLAPEAQELAAGVDANDLSMSSLSKRVVPMSTFDLKALQTQTEVQAVFLTPNFSKHHIQTVTVRSYADDGSADTKVTFIGRLKANDLIAERHMVAKPDGRVVRNASEP